MGNINNGIPIRVRQVRGVRIMKKFIILALIVLVMSSFVIADLTTNLEVYYSFDDADITGGSNQLDLSGNGFTATNNGATDGVAGIVAQAYDFDGSVPEWMEADAFITGRTDSTGTFCWWVYPDALSSRRMWAYADVGSSSNSRTEPNLHSGSSKLRFMIRDGVGWDSNFYGNSALSTGQWYHMCMVQDGVAATMYIDGALQTETGGAYWMDDQPGIDTFRLGAQAHQAVPSTYALDGKLDEFGYWSAVLSGADIALLYNSGAGCPYSLLASDCSAATDTLNISDSLPVNNSQFNTLLLHFNLTANASEAFTADFYVNGALNQTRDYTLGTNVLVDFNLTFLNTTETTLTYYFYVNTSSDNDTTLNKTVHIDNVFPQITWNTPNNLNTTVIGDTLLSNIFLEDPNMFSYAYNITYPNGTQYHYSSNDTLTGLANYTINDTVSFTGKNGTFYAYAEVCDGHTDNNITIHSVEIVNETLLIEDEGDQINVSMANEEDTESVSYIEEPNKISFGFVSDTTTSSEQFIVESNHYIHILDGLTEYEGHLVMGKKWMDFETDDLQSVHIVRLTDYSVEVTVTKFTSTDEWDFESIGELNCRNQTRSFLVHVPTTGNNSQVLSGDLSPYLLNVTMNSSFYTTANATLYWNGTGYLATATNTSTHFYFNYTLAIPPLLNDTNVTYYWNYYLGTTEFNTSNENTTVYSPRVSNCTVNPTNWVDYLIKDETFETLLNGSITFIFDYYNNEYNNTFSGLMTDNSTFPICMYPSWGNFSTNATIQYQTSEAGYTSREYQTTGFEVYESNRTVDLFLLEGATDITFHIIDDSDNNLEGVTVEAYRYRIATDEDVLVETEATDAEGKVILNLASGTTFYSFKIYNNESVLKISTARFKLFSTEYEYIIQEGRENPLATRSNILSRLTQSLTYNLNGNNIINYTYNYTGALVNQWCFTVTANASTYNSQCSNNSAGAFNYTLTPNNLTYLATVLAYTNESDYVVANIDILTNTQLKDVFGNTNTLFIAMIMFLTISMIGLVSANIAIVLSVLSLMIIGLFNLLPLSNTWIAGAVALALGMLWVVNKR